MGSFLDHASSFMKINWVLFLISCWQRTHKPNQKHNLLGRVDTNNLNIHLQDYIKVWTFHNLLWFMASKVFKNSLFKVFFWRLKYQQTNLSSKKYSIMSWRWGFLLDVKLNMWSTYAVLFSLCLEDSLLLLKSLNGITGIGYFLCDSVCVCVCKQLASLGAEECYEWSNEWFDFLHACCDANLCMQRDCVDAFM